MLSVRSLRSVSSASFTLLQFLRKLVVLLTTYTLIHLLAPKSTHFILELHCILIGCICLIALLPTPQQRRLARSWTQRRLALADPGLHSLTRLDSTRFLLPARQSTRFPSPNQRGSHLRIDAIQYWPQPP
ncbi:hypothetical protein C8R43DRAFT_1007380 [Mycena crocata]|nr:hypothetical protein C8R43DRAFT_1007380 [Mycena crocata]